MFDRRTAVGTNLRWIVAVAVGLSPAVSLAYVQDMPCATCESDFQTTLQGYVNNPAITEIRFGAGRYNLCTNQDPGLNGSPCISISRSNLVLSGILGQTEIVVGTPYRGVFSLSSVSNVTLTNLTIDYATPPFTQGNVTAVQKPYFWVQTHAGMPSLGHQMFTDVNSPGGRGPGLLFDSAGAMKRNAHNWVPVDDIVWDPSRNAWRLHVSDLWAWDRIFLAVGDRYAQTARRDANPLIFAYSSSNIIVDGVRLYASPGAGVVIQECGGWLQVQNSRIEPRPGSGRYVSLNADAIHMQQNSGQPIIVNNTFAGMADDAINIYSVATNINWRDGGRWIRVDGWGNRYAPNEWIQVVERGSGMIRYTARIVSCGNGTQGNGRCSNDENGVLLYLDRSTPALDPGTGTLTVFNTSAAGNNAILDSNTFLRHRGYGVRNLGSGSVVRYNSFRDINTAGVRLAPGWDWAEGPGSDNIKIEFNSFTGGDTMSECPEGPCPQLWVEWPGQSSSVTSYEGHRNITIRGNTFYSAKGENIRLHGINYAFLESNSIYNYSTARLASGPLIYIDRSSTVRMNKLTAYDYRGNTTAAIRLGPGTAPYVGGWYQWGTLSGNLGGRPWYQDQRSPNINESNIFSSLVFDWEFYRAVNPDLSYLASYQQAKDHWRQHGLHEGRMAHPSFHARDYLELNPYLEQLCGAANYDCAVDYYLWVYGGTARHALIPEVFDWWWYGYYNPDLIAAYGWDAWQLKNHWLRHGSWEGRRAHPNWWVQQYYWNYPDLQAGYGANWLELIRHYSIYGRYEGRTG
jgi:hypothetical protein